METKERYDELCRLCASYDAVKMNIFGKEGKNRQLVDKIQTCLPFRIDEDDRLPKCLCYRCMYNLENFYDFRTACVNAVALLERCLPPGINAADSEVQNDVENYSELRTELLKEKEKMPILIPEAPIVNPNAALGTPPRLNSDGEADQEIEEILDASGTEDGFEDTEDRKSDEYEMDMETNPSDFLEMTPMVTEELDDNEPVKTPKTEIRNNDVFQHTAEQHEVYVCSLCNKAFSSKGHLSLHARIHVGAGDVIGAKVVTDDHTSYKRPYQCDLCNKSYSTAKHRWGHVSTTHRGHPAVTCAYCSRIYSTRTNLEEHIKSRHTGLPPPPELPIPYVQPDNRYKCKTCPKMYTTITELNKHGRVCTGDRTKVKTNKKVSRKNKNLMDTSDLSSTDTDIDGKDYRNAEAKLSKNPQLTILKQALTKGETSKRDYDDRNSSNYKLVELSKTDVNDGDGQKRWYCETCPQNFSSVENLKDHETTHDAERPYICVLCEKDFVVKSSLSRHIMSSHGVDPSPIIDSDKCLKKSVLSQSWTRQLIKTEPKKTGRDGSLSSEDGESAHGNMIEIETVFVCEICTRDFNDRASLWLHIRATHKECAAFACGVCLKICSDNAQLLNHVNMYHGGSKLLISEQRRYSCTICGRQHDSRKKLMTHVSIHNVDPGYDPASFVQLNSNYYNENVNSNETNEALMDFDVEDGDKVDCYICYKSFPNEDHLIRHQRNAHKSEPVIPSGADVLPASNGSGTGPNGTKAQYHLFFVCELCGSSHPSKWERWLHVSSNHSEESSIRCEREDCGKIFATKTLRNDHAQHHLIQGSSPNTCEVCGKLWGSRVDYWKHVMGVHSDTVPLICGVCLKVFPDVKKLSNHVKTNHWPLTNGDFSCDVCGRPYSNKSKMSRHRKIHGLEIDNATTNNGTNDISNNDSSIHEKSAPTTETELTCELCTDLIFYNWESLCNHRRSLHGLFPCDLCNKCYGRTSHLWKHVNRVHKGHKDVTCRYCMKTSASKDHLAAHISKIHRYEPYDKIEISESPSFKRTTIEDDGVHQCDKCNKGFHKRYLLRRHMKGCQNYRKDPGALLTRCRACERIFKDRASLQKHIENHHSSYTCHLCDETVTSKLGIMTHNRVNHMDHPDLTCNDDSCKKLFRTKEDLESHRKDHKYHNAPNVCDFCGDTVENKLKLKMHVLSLHRNEIGVSCGVCLIPMKDPKILKKHVEDEHTGVLLKPNTCQVCGKQYASKWKAFDHTKKCHGKVFRTCKQCLAVFTTDTDIRYHYEHIHNVPKDQLAGFEKRFRMRTDDYENSDVVVKEEPEDYDYDDGICDDESYDYKRRRNDTYDCDICPEIFLNRETLSDHYTNVHNKDPQKMFKKIKYDGTCTKRKMRNRENFECKNCGKQFCTKTLFWNHINVCTRRNNACNRDDETRLPTSILEAHLKNNNKIKKEPFDDETPLNDNNLNIPDFNLFEDINMQLSEQKPVPNLMPLSQIRHLNSMKCSRKDSRKVYDESTNTVCTCEVCGKPWPAKKHLWQHLIRFHRAEAAVTCGVCLKLCSNYEELAIHLKSTHESILTCEGNNFTCKTCGRYHNARSKLLLHMSIHINSNGIAWCPKCEQSFESDEKLTEHLENCVKRQPDYEDRSIDNEDSKHDDDDKGSLIGDADFSDHRPSNSENTEDSESSSAESASDDDENPIKHEDESRTNSRATVDRSCRSETDEEADSDDEDVVIEEKEIARLNKMETSENIEEKRVDETSKRDDEDEDEDDDDEEDDVDDVDDVENVEEEKESGISANDTKDKNNCDEKTKNPTIEDDSDDDGPPVLSPVMPLSVEHETEETDDVVGHKLSPMIPIEPKILDITQTTNETPTKLRRIDDEMNNPTYSDVEVHPVNEKIPLEDYETDEEEADGELNEDVRDEIDDEDSRIHVVNPNDEYHSDDNGGTDESAAEDEQPFDEEQSEMEVGEDEDEEENEDEDDNGVEIHNLNGTVLMVAKDADGNQILIQKNVSDIVNGDSMEAVTGFIYEDETDFEELRGFQVEHEGSDHEAMEEEEEVQEEEEEEEGEGKEEEEEEDEEEGKEEEGEEGEEQEQEKEEEGEEEEEEQEEDEEAASGNEKNGQEDEAMEEGVLEGSKEVQDDEREELSDREGASDREEEEGKEEVDEEEVEEEEEEEEEEGGGDGEGEECDVQDSNTSAKSDVSRT